MTSKREMITRRTFAFNGDRLNGERGLAVYRRGDVISIHRIYSAGETNIPGVDGWSNHSSLEEARHAWQATQKRWTDAGWRIS